MPSEGVKDNLVQMLPLDPVLEGRHVESRHTSAMISLLAEQPLVEASERCCMAQSYLLIQTRRMMMIYRMTCNMSQEARKKERNGRNERKSYGNAAGMMYREEYETRQR